ncbi:cilia- and flagella-associated protein 61 [Venturia canescens]|uniref:cilia- and flagella-associated protein 61 n=1 Tax=Venturia canescens TaxID=32260 RepID=UPI001C9C39B0|nr:cilia- and flagella-associated protein 61 [Venturia canescens]
MNSGIHERHGRDYLEAAFECFPDLDYCVMLQPSTQPSELRLDELYRNYDVESFVSMKNTLRDDHAQLLHFITIPVFSVHDKIFFCELMRLSFTTVLYYRLYDCETTVANRTQPLITCLDAMIPVRSRTRFHHPYVQVGKESSEAEPFSLFLMTPRFAVTTKPVVNSKIVVVGASDCGVAFSEFLAFQDSDLVHFTNLTIVSPNGTPFESSETSEHATMIPYKGKYCYQYRKFVSSRVWMNVVHGIVSQINRKEKYVVVSGLGTLNYDYLVLTCGLQYQVPNFQENRENDENSVQETAPLNCFCINDDVEGATCLERLKELTNDFATRKFIVIYGRNIECLCTLNNLLENGVKGSWIIMIEPKYSECGKPSDIFFEDDEVAEAVKKSMKKAGVKIISGWDLTDWIIEVSESVIENEMTRTSVIKSLRIESKTENKLVTCDALIYFGDKKLPRKTFMAISRAGLVFDGRLVIDPDCSTNDPSVFAAGAVTKYSRKYNAERWQHQYYSSVEVGERLAQILKEKTQYDGSDEGNKNADCSESNFQKHTNLPEFRAPIIVYCRLPGGLKYLHVRKPGKKIARVIEIARGTYGEVLITGNPSMISDIGYFRIRFNQFNRVETITCLHKMDFPFQDFITLYGKHDSMLNNVKLRFRYSLIIDFFAYFAEPWAAALFHDRFDALRLENRAILLSEAGMQSSSLIEDIMNVCMKSNWKELSEENSQDIESKYAGSIYQEAISSNVMNFLQEAEEVLPMYCNPCKLRRQLQDD